MPGWTNKSPNLFIQWRWTPIKTHSRNTSLQVVEQMLRFGSKCASAAFFERNDGKSHPLLECSPWRFAVHPHYIPAGIAHCCCRLSVGYTRIISNIYHDSDSYWFTLFLSSKLNSQKMATRCYLCSWTCWGCTQPDAGPTRPRAWIGRKPHSSLATSPKLRIEHGCDIRHAGRKTHGTTENLG